MALAGFFMAFFCELKVGGPAKALEMPPKGLGREEGRRPGPKVMKVSSF